MSPEQSGSSVGGKSPSHYALIRVADVIREACKEDSIEAIFDLYKSADSVDEKWGRWTLRRGTIFDCDRVAGAVKWFNDYNCADPTYHNARLTRRFWVFVSFLLTYVVDLVPGTISFNSVTMQRAWKDPMLFKCAQPLYDYFPKKYQVMLWGYLVHETLKWIVVSLLSIAGHRRIVELVNYFVEHVPHLVTTDDCDIWDYDPSVL